MSSGAGFGRGEGASCFLRAFPVEDLAFPMASDFGSAGAIGGGRGGPLRGGGEAGPGGGDTEGSGEGGETDVMSTDGDRCREGDRWGLGDGELSGAGGGGSTKWNVREAIWICELRMRQKDRTHVKIGGEIPFAQGNFVTLTTPSPIHPSTVSAQHDKNKPFLPLLVFDAGMETRNAL